MTSTTNIRNGLIMDKTLMARIQETHPDYLFFIAFSEGINSVFNLKVCNISDMDDFRVYTCPFIRDEMSNFVAALSDTYTQFLKDPYWEKQMSDAQTDHKIWIDDPIQDLQIKYPLYPDPTDNINPDHYKTESGQECIDLLIEMGLGEGYLLGSAIKYIFRRHNKDTTSTNIAKAINCLKLYKERILDAESTNNEKE